MRQPRLSEIDVFSFNRHSQLNVFLLTLKNAIDFKIKNLFR